MIFDNAPKKILKRYSNYSVALILLVIIAAPGAFSQTGAEIDDWDITVAVENDLLWDKQVSADLIDVSTADGVVTLSGTVSNLLAKEQAEDIALSIRGVVSVVNNIKVRPVERNDSIIEEDIKNAYLYDPATESFEIDVSSVNGIITLTGKVQSFQEKMLAEEVAKGIKGVRGVDNRIEITYPEVRTDSEIKNDILGRYNYDAMIEAELIEVNVNDGMVTLSGSVGSAAEYRRAYHDAWVAGVDAVNAENLDIEWWAREEMQKTGMATLTDSQIVEGVQDAFFYDPRIYAENINVTANKGIVTLTGKVNNLKAKRAAAADARNTRGVWKVNNRLKVRPANLPANDILEERVNAALERDPYVEHFDISVTAVNGNVYLDGEVGSSFEKNRAEDVVSRVNGVVSIVNLVDAIHRWSWNTDWEIKDDVQRQLFWSPYVNAEDITVAVDDGVVTLEGSVASWTERTRAEENAYQGGAKDVRNRLRVEEWDFPIPEHPLKRP